MGMIAYNGQSMNGQRCQGMGMGQQLDQFFNFERLSDFDYQEQGLIVFANGFRIVDVQIFTADGILIRNSKYIRAFSALSCMCSSRLFHYCDGCKFNMLNFVTPCMLS